MPLAFRRHCFSAGGDTRVLAFSYRSRRRCRRKNEADRVRRVGGRFPIGWAWVDGDWFANRRAVGGCLRAWASRALKRRRWTARGGQAISLSSNVIDRRVGQHGRRPAGLGERRRRLSSGFRSCKRSPCHDRSEDRTLPEFWRAARRGLVQSQCSRTVTRSIVVLPREPSARFIVMQLPSLLGEQEASCGGTGIRCRRGGRRFCLRTRGLVDLP